MLKVLENSRVASIFQYAMWVLVIWNGFYSPDKLQRELAEVRKELKFDTIVCLTFVINMQKDPENPGVALTSSRLNVLQSWTPRIVENYQFYGKIVEPKLFRVKFYIVKVPYNFYLLKITKLLEKVPLIKKCMKYLVNSFHSSVELWLNLNIISK